jgi:hypothetical protein
VFLFSRKIIPSSRQDIFCALHSQRGDESETSKGFLAR